MYLDFTAEQQALLDGLQRTASVGVTRQQNPARSVRTEAEVQVGPPHLAGHHVKFGTSPMGSICVVVDQVDVGRATFRGVRH